MKVKNLRKQQGFRCLNLKLVSEGDDGDSPDKVRLGD